MRRWGRSRRGLGGWGVKVDRSSLRHGSVSDGGLFPVHPGKCSPQLSRLMKATTCSSLKANLCFLAASSCSSAHTICKVNTLTHKFEELDPLE